MSDHYGYPCPEQRLSPPDPPEWIDCAACREEIAFADSHECESCEASLCDSANSWQVGGCAQECHLCELIFCPECMEKHKSVHQCTPGEVIA